MLGHLGFVFEDEEGVPLQQETGPGGKRAPTGENAPSQSNSQFLSWGGTSAMSFEVGWFDRPVCCWSLGLIGCQPFYVHVSVLGYCSTLAGAWMVWRHGVGWVVGGCAVVRPDNHHQVRGQTRLPLCARGAAL